MKDSKPNWQKTNINWEIRKVILQQLARGQTITEIVNFFQLNADRYTNAPSDRGTISKVIKELKSMPPELLKTLIKEVPEAEAYILENRQDLKASEISSNSTTLDQSLNTDPLILEAQKAHLSDIQQIIEQWRELVSIPHSNEIIPNKYDQHPVNIVENNALFVYLKEHIHYPKLWVDYFMWKYWVDGYSTLFGEIMLSIRRDRSLDTGLKTDDGRLIWAEIDSYPFHEPIVDRIEYMIEKCRDTNFSCRHSRKE
jgi:hypothetical protein